MEPNNDSIVCQHGGLRRKCDTCAAEEEVRRLTAALKAIRDFGKKNPGYGFSCSRMAAEALLGPVIPFSDRQPPNDYDYVATSCSETDTKPRATVAPCMIAVPSQASHSGGESLSGDHN